MFAWIEYDTEKDEMYCIICRKFKHVLNVEKYSKFITGSDTSVQNGVPVNKFIGLEEVEDATVNCVLSAIDNVLQTRKGTRHDKGLVN